VELPGAAVGAAARPPDAVVTGLDVGAPADRPPVAITHYSFDLMVGIGFGCSRWRWALWRWRGAEFLFDAPWFVRRGRGVRAGGGGGADRRWIVTEVGRQPWIVHLRAAHGATRSPTSPACTGTSTDRSSCTRCWRVARTHPAPAGRAPHARLPRGAAGLAFREPPPTGSCSSSVPASIAYTVLGGADFGGGVWDLFAPGPRRDASARSSRTTMGPVWEANHVWLVFVLIGLFSGFPLAFGALARMLAVAARGGTAGHRAARCGVRVPAVRGCARRGGRRGFPAQRVGAGVRDRLHAGAG
jgi:hypothetical protein